MVNIPRAPLHGRTGRQSLYHISISELQAGPIPAKRLSHSKAIPALSGSARKENASGSQRLLEIKDERASYRVDPHSPGRPSGRRAAFGSMAPPDPTRMVLVPPAT
jgi:hypothetical protein